LADGSFPCTSGDGVCGLLNDSGASVEVTCYEADGVTTSTCDSTSTASAISEGTSNGSRRAFEVDIIDATSTGP
jgi:hypothetical protein